MHCLDAASTMNAEFAVIVPYFQRSSGLLFRTLQSISEQQIDCRVNIYVVDDGSPAPVEDELTGLVWRENFCLQVIKKQNGGVASARNVALNSIKGELYVAFLDSDDVWFPHHLDAALFAFSSGFDFYTADWLLKGQNVSSFAHFYGSAMRLESIEGIDWGFALKDCLIDFTVNGPIGSTCSMVVKRKFVDKFRFNEDLTTAGEDGLFATQIAFLNPRVFISKRFDVILGHGVSIFSSGDWHDAQGFSRAASYLRSRELMRPLVADFPTARSNLGQVLRRARVDYLSSLISTILRMKFSRLADYTLLIRFPGVVLELPYLLSKIFKAKFCKAV